jgi:hydroxysqualene synthase
LDLARSYRHCRHLAFGHYENFPVASLLLPQPQRDAIAAVYAYARSADDFADEPQFKGQREALLKDWMRRLDRPAAGHPVFLALHDAMRRWSLPKPLLRNLVKSFLQDLRKKSYKDQRELYAYCRLSADPVGRLVLRVFKAESAANLKDSDAICTALQLANHWQDLGADIRERGRVYLPQDALRRHGVKPAQLRAPQAGWALKAALEEQVGIADALFERGEGLCGRLTGRLGLEIRLTVAGGRRVLQKIRALGFDTLAARPRLGKADGLGLLWLALRGRTA